MSRTTYIWPKDIPQQRLTVVAFRYELSLDSIPAEALFHCFASTHYHLHVNGAAVGYGPARSMPSHPSFDSYDLAPYLQQGENVIAVLAAHAAGYSFHHQPMPGAFVAWGHCADYNLSTDSEIWSCCVSAGHDVNPPRWSFAVPVIEMCDEREWPQGWNAVGTPAGQWTRPAPVDSSAFGELVPREMPPLTDEALQIEQIVQAYTHSDAERIHGFRIVRDFHLTELRYEKARTAAYTWIHSERAQTITAGTWWGEHFLNGEALEQVPAKDGQHMRTDVQLQLKQGWNLLFISYGMMHACWECQIALPADIQIDANRGQGGDAVAFYVSETLPFEEFEQHCSDIPSHQEYLSQLKFDWQPQAPNAVCVSPERRLAWAVPDQQIAFDQNCPLPMTLPANTASSVIADFGRIGLGRLCLEVEAPAGTIFDIYYHEELKDGRPPYGKNCVSYTADRRIAAGSGRLEWFFPRGCKFVEISVAGNENDVRINNISLIEMRYPYSSDGAFACSDPRLNTLWSYGVETLRNCSEDVITDCPWRERTMYGGDLLVEMAVGTVYSRDLQLVRRCIDVYLQCQHPEFGGLPGRAPCLPTQNPLGEYQLMVVLAASWHLRLTGDVDFARRIEAQIDLLMSQFKQRDVDTGLYYFKNTFIEHVKTQKKGLVAAGNACLAGSFRAYADFLERLGRSDDAAAARSEGEHIDAAVNKCLWDADRKLYKAGIGEEDAPGNPYQLHASFYPGCFRSTTQDIDSVLADSYTSELQEMAENPELRSPDFHGRRDTDFSAYGAFYMLQHLAHMGRADIAEDVILRFYGDMLRHPTGTIWEHFNSGKSLCHAWSAAPTWYASTQILGVQMCFEPGESPDEIHIAPQSETLSWARGTVPHPAGDVFVAWTMRGDTLQLQYRAPTGAAVHIAPRGRLAGLRLHVQDLAESQGWELVTH